MAEEATEETNLVWGAVRLQLLMLTTKNQITCAHNDKTCYDHLMLPIHGPQAKVGTGIGATTSTCIDLIGGKERKTCQNCVCNIPLMGTSCTECADTPASTCKRPETTSVCESQIAM